MRQSQKTENKADYLRRVTLEGSEQTGARSVVSGEKRTQNGSLRAKVLDRNNLNRAFVNVKSNKEAGGIDGSVCRRTRSILERENSKLIEALRPKAMSLNPLNELRFLSQTVRSVSWKFLRSLIVWSNRSYNSNCPLFLKKCSQIIVMLSAHSGVCKTQSIKWSATTIRDITTW